MTRHAKKFRRIAQKLGRIELMETAQDDFALGDDLVGDQAGRRGPARFLDFYGSEGIALALSRYGFVEYLQERGYGELEYRLELRDDRHTLIIEAQHPELSNVVRVMELAVRKSRLVPSELPGLDRAFDVLTVDWLMMRDPLSHFTAARPRLPGQDAPGLGLASQVLEMLYRVVERLKLDGLVTTGEHFHNAVMYRQEMSHLDAQAGGYCVALEDALLSRERLSLAAASWAVDWGCVSHSDTGEAVEWQGGVQVRGHHAELVAFLRNEERRRERILEAALFSFALDRDALTSRLRSEGIAESPGLVKREAK